jgi:hypothetical protein
VNCGFRLGALVLLAAAATAPIQCQPPKTNAAGAYIVPRTADGQPDLQGIWTNLTLTPLERPPKLSGKAFFTPAEAAEYEKHAPEREFVYAFRERGNVVATLRTSLIIDPPDGRLPAMTADGKKRAAEQAIEMKQHGFDGPESRSPWERCIIATNNAGPPMMPTFNNSNYQIVQGRGYVVILSEQIHDARVIPVDGRPHLPANVHQWMGNSTGHWEGNTLVVETANFDSRTHYAGTGAGLKLTERFMRTAPNIILYEFTVDDPATFTRPWTVQYPFVATDGPLFEYACHEGNYAMKNMLSGARAEEAAPKTSK